MNTLGQYSDLSNLEQRDLDEGTIDHAAINGPLCPYTTFGVKK